MAKILNVLFIGLLIIGLTGCNNEPNVNDENNLENENFVEENDNEQIEIAYDKIIHCDIEAGIPGSLAMEADGTYYEYYILNNEVVKYVRFQVLPDEVSEKDIENYLLHLENDRGYKNVEKIENNIKITIENESDAYEDYNPLPTTVSEVEKMANNNSNCYIKK